MLYDIEIIDKSSALRADEVGYTSVVVEAPKWRTDKAGNMKLPQDLLDYAWELAHDWAVSRSRTMEYWISEIQPVKLGYHHLNGRLSARSSRLFLSSVAPVTRRMFAAGARGRS